MDAVAVMTVVALLAVAVLCGVAVWALRDLVRTARSVSALADDIRTQVIPLAEKIDVTVDAVNLELLRFDDAMARFEDAGERVSSASGAIRDLVGAPAAVVTGVAERVRRAWKDRSRP